jgi:hypothetical protein
VETTSAVPSTPVAQKIPSQQQLVLANLMRAAGVAPKTLKAQSQAPQQSQPQKSTKQKVIDWNTSRGYSGEAVPTYYQDPNSFNNEYKGAGPDWFPWEKVKGSQDFFTPAPAQVSESIASTANVDPIAMAEWAKKNKYELHEEILDKGWTRRWIFDEKGEPVTDPHLVAPANDRDFWQAATLVAGSFAGPALSAAYGGGALGAAAAGATMSGALTYAETGSLRDAAKAAAISGGAQFLNFIPGFSTLPPMAKNAIGGAVNSALRGGNMNQALQSALISAVNTGQYTNNPTVNRMLGQMLGQQIARKMGPG